MAMWLSGYTLPQEVGLQCHSKQGMAINSSCEADRTIGHNQQLTGYWGIYFILGTTTCPCFPNQAKKQ